MSRRARPLDACEAAALDELRAATPEEWAALEGHALGRVLDEDPPTEPELLVFDLGDTPTPPVLSADPPPWAIAALQHEALGRGPYDATPPSFEPFAPSRTLLIPRDALEALIRRSSR